MKRIIDGVRYDTETSEEIASDSWGNYGDFGRWEEKLYRKKNGEYFLHGKGGPMTKYATHPRQNESCGGCEIIPMSDDEAREWLENVGDGEATEALEKYFSEQIRD